jgi:hypothetical protein
MKNKTIASNDKNKPSATKNSRIIPNNSRIIPNNTRIIPNNTRIIPNTNRNTISNKNLKNDEKIDNIPILSTNEWLSIYKHFETSTSIDNLIDYFLFCEMVLNPEELKKNVFEKNENEKMKKYPDLKKSVARTTSWGGVVKPVYPKAGRLNEA